MLTKTGFVYTSQFLQHLTGNNHPESPDRVSHTYQYLEAQGLLDPVVTISARPAETEWIEKVHANLYIDRVQQTCHSGVRVLDSLDTGISHDSYEIARLSVGAALNLVDAVMEKKVLNGFSLCRPPGHHAERELAMGFCLFNNAAVAARYVQEKYGLKKVLIVDWDVHHGNGTQNLFYDDPSVFYFSVHQFPFYPGTGSQDETGRGEARGMTLNVPLRAGCGDEEYGEIFRKIFYPAARHFAPDFVIISAGFDAHQNDPLGQMNVTSKGFEMMTRVVKELAEECSEGRLVSLLEGGYDLDGLAESVGVHLRTLAQSTPKHAVSLPKGVIRK